MGNYTKFMLLGRSRVGSGLLLNSLCEHPEVFTYGEVFGRQDMIKDFSGLEDDAHNPELVRLMNNEPEKFMNKVLFRPSRPGFPLRAVGFKFFYYHAGQNRERLLNHLAERKDIRIIHLTRRNQLKVMASLAQARATGQWRALADEQVKQVDSVELDYASCLQSFETTEAHEKWYNDFFKDHFMLKVAFEDLASHFSPVMTKVQEFLGLPVRNVAPATKKQRKRPISELVANYDQLHSQFQGTKWERYFAD